MNPTNESFKLIKKWEGLHRERADGLIEAYLDPVSIWTIGYGSIRHWDLGRPIQPNDVITKATAERWFMLEVEQVAEDVDRLCKAPLTQGMFDALVSFVYNIGIGAFGESTILKKINDQDYEGAAREFDRWVNGTDNGVRTILQGLVNRRNEEETMFRRDGLSPVGDAVPISSANPTSDQPAKEDRPYQPAPLPLPFDRTLQKGDIGNDCYILNCALAGLGLLRIAPQPNEFTEVTENAVRLLQRREALSRIDGLVGPETKRAIENALDPSERSVYCRLLRTGAKAEAYEGRDMEACKLQFVDPLRGVVASLDVISGLPGAQFFRTWDDPNSIPHNLEPIPQDRYAIADIDWAGGKDNYGVSHENQGIGPVWVSLTKPQGRPRNCDHAGCRDAFGFHADWNWIKHRISPGSEGCVCPTSEDDLRELVRLLREHDPRLLVVDWGL